MSDSILTNTKAALGLTEDYTAFDSELTMHINSALGVLNQLGIGPSDGFMISDKTETWSQLIGTETRYMMVKSFVYMKVKMLFDPPGVGYVVTAMEKQLEEMTSRISIMRECIDHPLSIILPNADGEEVVLTEPLIFDGGNP